MRIQDAVNEGVADYASRAEELFGMMYSDTAAFEERLRKGLVFSGADPHAENKVGLGSGLIDQSQKMTVAAMQMADMKVCAHRS